MTGPKDLGNTPSGAAGYLYGPFQGQSALLHVKGKRTGDHVARCFLLLAML